MTCEQLTTANRIREEIEELEIFISKAERRWTGRIVKREDFYIFKANAYGALDSADYFMNVNIKNKVLDVLREHLKSLKQQLESM